MFERPDDYLQRRAKELGLDRADKLAEIQAWLDKEYPGMCRAVSLNEGVLTIKVNNSSVASELRFRRAQTTIPGVKKISIKQI